MSTAPPPPPPPPPPYDRELASRGHRAQERHAAKQQRRAARLAVEQQRALLRARQRGEQRTSVVGPLLLVGIGAALFAVFSGHLPAPVALLWFGRWWPLVLVAAGMVLVAEWWLDARSDASRLPTGRPRRTLGVSGTLLLLCLTAAGLAASGLNWIPQNWRDHLDVRNPMTWEEWLEPHRESVHQLQHALKPGTKFVVQNHQGDITITGSSQDGLVHVTARQDAWAWQARSVESREKDNAPQFSEGDAELRLQVAGEDRDTTHLVIEVPHETAIEIEPEDGTVTVNELRGPVDVRDHSGNIELTALTGDVHLRMHDDDADITAHSLTGKVEVEGRSGDLTFTDLSGPLSLQGDFFGTTHLERVQGPVHFKSSFTTLDCAGVGGEVNVEGRSAIHGRDLRGPVNLATTDREITLEGIRKGVHVTNQKGSVTLSFAELSGPVDVRTTDGSIKVHVPPAAAFRLRAATSDGEVRNDFGLKSLTAQEGQNRLAGEVGKGGPAVDLTTTEGDVELLKTKADSGKAASDEERDDDDDDR